MEDEAVHKVEVDEETEEIFEDVLQLLEKIKSFSFQEATKIEDYKWIDEARVLCRDLSKRKQTRKEFYVFQKIKEVLEGIESKINLKDDDKIAIKINCFSVFANLVVDDDPETFATCFKVFNSGLFNTIVSKLNESVQAGSLSSDEKLQFVGSIALTNFTLQFSQNRKDIESKEDSILNELLSGKPENNPISVVCDMSYKGCNNGVKKSAVNLLARISDFEKLHQEIVENPSFEALLKYIKTTLHEVKSSTESAEYVDAAMKMLTSIFHRAKSSDVELLNQHCLKEIIQLLNPSNGFTDDLRNEAASFLMAIMKGRILMPGENETPEEAKSGVDKVILLSQLGIVDLLVENIVKLSDELFKINPFESNDVAEADSMIHYFLELLNLFLHPIDQQSATLDGLISKHFQKKLFDLVEFATIVIDITLSEAVEKKKDDPEADVNRDLVLSYAKIRKASLFILNLLATNYERCLELLKFRSSPIRSLPKDNKFKKFSFQGDLSILVGFIIVSMHNFDVEGTEVGVSLLKNLLIASDTRLMVLDSFDRNGRKCFELAKFGSCLAKMMMSPSHKLAILSTGICRLLSMLLEKEVVETYFDLETIKTIADMDVTKVNPVVRAESARFLCFLLRIFADASLTGELDGKFGKYRDIVVTQQVVTLIGFLLQSKHGVLIEEGIAALASCEEELRMKCLSEVQIFFDPNGEDIVMMKSLEEGDGEIEKMFAALSTIDDVDISEEDVNLSKLSDEEVKKKMAERAQENLETENEDSGDVKEDQTVKAESQDDEEKEKMKAVPLKLRIMQLSKDMFHSEDIEEEAHKRIVNYAKEVLNGK